MAWKIPVWEAAGKFLRELITTSSGAPDAGKGIALAANGKLDPSLLPDEALSDSVDQLEASETLSAGDMVNRWNDGGTIKMQKADRENNRPAHGFVKAAVTATQTGGFYKEGEVPKTGLTVGVDYYLGTAGGITTTPDPGALGSGHLIQPIGVAMSATALDFERGEVTTHA